MSSSTALLPKDRKKDDHPIFLRVCHSPWTAIGQQALVALRGLVAAYMVVSFGMIIDYELKRNKRGWETAFEYSTITYFMQALYHVIAFMWTFMHLHYPHHGSQAQTTSTIVQKLMSPPRQHASTQNRTWFSIFYTAANSFPYTAIFIHWAVMEPMKKTMPPASEIFHHGWFTTFFAMNKWAGTGFFAFVEVMVFSSIRSPEPISAHVAGLSVLTWFYVFWAYIGYIVTDKYPLFFLDHKEVGWEYTISSWAFFAVANIVGYAIVYGLSAIRRELTKKSESKKSGYQALPQ